MFYWDIKLIIKLNIYKYESYCVHFFCCFAIRELVSTKIF